MKERQSIVNSYGGGLGLEGIDFGAGGAYRGPVGTGAKDVEMVSRSISLKKKSMNQFQAAQEHVGLY